MSARHSVLLWIVVGLGLSATSSSAEAAADVYQCAGPNGTALYTDRDRPGCQALVLDSVTLAPSRFPAQAEKGTTGLRPFPESWFDYSAPVGAQRHRMAPGGLYGRQDWIDYDAPVGSLRNSVTTWPSPYGLYGW
jgi:hypothetical protein